MKNEFPSPRVFLILFWMLLQKNLKTILTVSLFITAGLGLGYFTSQVMQNNSENGEISEAATEEAPKLPSLEEVYPYKIEPRETLYSVLRELNVPGPTIHEITQAAKPILNLGKLRPGIRFQVKASANPQLGIEGIKFWFSPVEMLEIKLINQAWAAEKITEQIEIRTKTFSGTVTSSLWESAEKAEMDPNLISDLAEIFAWQVDFAREVRVNDRWRLSVEQKVVKGEAIGWGAILVAEYINDGQNHSAILFRKDGKEIGYFGPDGASLRRMFLKSPIRYGRISSRFQRARFHPILQINRPHLGVDYAAPIGTPIRAVGDGVIAFAGWRGGAGKAIRLRHNSIYETAYKHLNGFAKGIRAGARVRQGDIIGYVGNTGLSTGPHLHFEFFQSGRFVDPLSKKFPSADPVPAAMIAEFKAEATNLLASLPAWDQPTAMKNQVAIEPTAGGGNPLGDKASF